MSELNLFDFLYSLSRSNYCKSKVHLILIMMLKVGQANFHQMHVPYDGAPKLIFSDVDIFAVYL